MRGAASACRPPAGPGPCPPRPGARPAGTPDLELTVDASNPARSVVESLAGRRPAVGIVGDAALATDVSWLMDNLRWDPQDDLARFIGEAPAHELARLGRMLAG